MMMVTLLNTMMLITKVLLAAKTDCNWFASTQLPYLLAGGHHLTLVLVSMMMMRAMMMMMVQAMWSTAAGCKNFSHHPARLLEHHHYALLTHGLIATSHGTRTFCNLLSPLAENNFTRCSQYFSFAQGFGSFLLRIISAILLDGHLQSEPLPTNWTNPKYSVQNSHWLPHLCKDS